MIVSCSYLAPSSATLEMVPLNPPPELLSLGISVAVPQNKQVNFKISNDRVITNQGTILLGYSIDKPQTGTLNLFASSQKIASVESPTTALNTGTINATTLEENLSNIPIILQFIATNGASSVSKTLYVTVDTIGPKLEHAELVDVPSSGLTLLVKFAEGDFQSPPSLKKDQFQVLRQDKSGAFTDPISPQTEPIVDGNTVRLFFANMPAGLYRLVVKGKIAADAVNGSAGVQAALTDQVGNPAGGGEDQKWEFSVLADRNFGKHVEFTPYAPPTKQAIPKEGFNPGDFVETRVARLYYYRDAHRVAEIINRNIRSYNQAAVTQAERRAEKSRDDANNSTDERRKSEREAVRSAEQARNAEQQLAAARETLAETQGLQNTVADEKTKLDLLPKDSADAKKLQAKINQEDAVLARFGGPTAIETLKKNVTAMEQSVASLRQTELVKQEAAAGADAKESRAREKQFRNEVSAAETDPDTYVAGDMHSVDPVTQVSISVIGEGLIQLRGPVKGINKIRTMINEIDSPVGQIKIGIFSVQVNGEKGDKMEKVVGDAEGSIDLSRFLVNQSLNLLRRAIQSEAAMIAEQCAMEGHYQVDRDRRYLYSFFGRDFIDELYAMNSEFLNTENKLLSLHAMDTVSLNRALFILSLAKNDVRARIVSRFLEATKTELADAEFDFRRSGELKPHITEKRFPPWNRTHLPVKNHYHKEDVILEAVHRNAQQRYHFRNFNGFFDTGFTNPDTMNPMQREFIRLAQIFKARLVAEMELKQRVLERGLIEDRSNDEEMLYKVLSNVRDKAYIDLEGAYLGLLESSKNLQNAADILKRIQTEIARMPTSAANDANARAASQALVDANNKIARSNTDVEKEAVIKSFYEANSMQVAKNWLAIAKDAKWLTSAVRDQVRQVLLEQYNPNITSWSEALNNVKSQMTEKKDKWQKLTMSFPAFDRAIRNESSRLDELDAAFKEIMVPLSELLDTEFGNYISIQSNQLYRDKSKFLGSKGVRDNISSFLTESRAPLDHRKLLNHLIDEQEEKFIELVEGVRSHIAVMDDYLKRLSIAIEDDFKVQFYDPMFVRVRDAARSQDVNLGQVERTTILTNNRAFAKVDPQATMEFDLPKRQIAIKEAFDAAKALVEDTGALVNDPTFLSAFQMMGGSKQPTTVKNIVPGQSQSTDQQTMGLAPKPQESGAPGSALQSLVPEPSIYKLETGTGFQIRPVMQPDGDSVVYDFDYMYTTNIREPVRADEKHIGRIKRHFVHTAVQTANFELREISRYQVALKVSRTSQGVPLLQDIPVLGRAFKPAPSAESSIQQNIILGQTNVYPTLFDLMGLRWAQQVVDLDHTSLMESEHVIRGRQKSIRDYVFGESSKRVDAFLNIPGNAPDQFRPDLYHSQSSPSPYHPNGYHYPSGVQDPTGNNFERKDNRPADLQEPPYERYRHQPAASERIAPQIVPERITPRDSQPVELRAPISYPSRIQQGGSSRRQPQPQSPVIIGNPTGRNVHRINDTSVRPASATGRPTPR